MFPLMVLILFIKFFLMSILIQVRNIMKRF